VAVTHNFCAALPTGLRRVLRQLRDAPHTILGVPLAHAPRLLGAFRAAHAPRLLGAFRAALARSEPELCAPRRTRRRENMCWERRRRRRRQSESGGVRTKVEEERQPPAVWPGRARGARLAARRARRRPRS